MHHRGTRGREITCLWVKLTSAKDGVGPYIRLDFTSFSTSVSCNTTASLPVTSVDPSSTRFVVQITNLARFCRDCLTAIYHTPTSTTPSHIYHQACSSVYTPQINMLPERATRRTFMDDPDVRSLPLVYIVIPSVFCIASGWFIVYTMYQVVSKPEIESTNASLSALFATSVGFILTCVGLYGLWLWTQLWERASKAIFRSFVCLAAGWSMMGYIIYRCYYYPESRLKAWLSVLTINVGCFLGFYGLHGLWVWIRTWKGGPDAIVTNETKGNEGKENLSTREEKQRARAFSYYGGLTE